MVYSLAFKGFFPNEKTLQVESQHKTHPFALDRLF